MAHNSHQQNTERHRAYIRNEGVGRATKSVKLSNWEQHIYRNEKRRKRRSIKPKLSTAIYDAARIFKKYFPSFFFFFFFCTSLSLYRTYVRLWLPWMWITFRILCLKRHSDATTQQMSISSWISLVVVFFAILFFFVFFYYYFGCCGNAIRTTQEYAMVCNVTVAF